MSPQPDDGSITTGGVHGAVHAPRARGFAVSPTTGTKTNTLRAPLRPAACWRIESHRFDVGSSFIVPNGAVEFASLAARRPPATDETRKDALKLAIFGHTDATGSVAANKALSGRRALALYGLLTRDLDVWVHLYDSGGAAAHGDAWGVRSLQWMLAALGFPPGRISGQLDENTKPALRRFQSSAGLGASGNADAGTRRALFEKYMDVVCVDGKGTPFRYVAEDFVGAPGDGTRKGACQGCSEHNPIVVPSKTHAKELERPEKKAQRDEEYRNNRRVIVYLFPADTAIDPATWPCPTTDEGPGACKKMFWHDGETRREPADAAREHVRQEATFSCRFYDSLARFSPCEATRRTVAVWLHDRAGKRMPMTPYRTSLGGETSVQHADGEGKARIEGVFGTDDASIEWGVAKGPAGDTPLFLYRSSVCLEVDDHAERGAEGMLFEARNRLANLGYASGNFYDDVMAFQREHGLDETSWPDDATKDALWNKHAGGTEKPSAETGDGDAAVPSLDAILIEHSR